MSKTRLGKAELNAKQGKGWWLAVMVANFTCSLGARIVAIGSGEYQLNRPIIEPEDGQRASHIQDILAECQDFIHIIACKSLTTNCQIMNFLNSVCKRN